MFQIFCRSHEILGHWILSRSYLKVIWGHFLATIFHYFWPIFPRNRATYTYAIANVNIWDEILLEFFFRKNFKFKNLFLGDVWGTKNGGVLTFQTWTCRHSPGQKHKTRPNQNSKRFQNETIPWDFGIKLFFFQIILKFPGSFSLNYMLKDRPIWALRIVQFHFSRLSTFTPYERSFSSPKVVQFAASWTSTFGFHFFGPFSLTSYYRPLWPKTVHFGLNLFIKITGRKSGPNRDSRDRVVFVNIQFRVQLNIYFII